MNQEQLARSQSDRMIAGVCGGLATYLNIDPTLVRLAFVLLLLASGIGLPIYLILWVVMPKGPSAEEEMIKIGGDADPSVYKTKNTERRPTTTVGIVFVLLGFFFLFSRLGWFGNGGFWLILLAGAGFYALWRWWQANQ